MREQNSIVGATGRRVPVDPPAADPAEREPARAVQSAQRPPSRATSTRRPPRKRPRSASLSGKVWKPATGLAVVVLTGLLPLLNISVPGVLPGPTYTPGTLQLLATCMLIAALALSYHLLLGVAGMLSFGHALYFGTGVYGLAMILKYLRLPLLPAMVLTFVIAVLLAHLVGAISLRVAGIPFAMVTLAFAQAGSVIVGRNPGGATGGDEGLALSTEQVPDFLVGVVNTRNLYWIALAVLLVVYAVVSWTERSRAGHVATAVRENELRVEVFGLRPYLVKLLVFVVAAVLASVVGMVYLLLQSGAVPRSVSSDLTITLLVMVVLGGVGSRWGAIVGGVFYTLLDERLTALANSAAIAGLPPVLRIPLSEPLFILGTLFILVVLFLPGGIAGTFDRLTKRGSDGRSRGDDLEEVV